MVLLKLCEGPWEFLRSAEPIMFKDTKIACKILRMWFLGGCRELLFASRVGHLDKCEVILYAKSELFSIFAVIQFFGHHFIAF